MAATSAGSAWAVGITAGYGYSATTRVHALPKTVILHWNGTTWTRMPILRQGGFTSVAGTSASNAWAVGSASTGKTLILHWNGTVRK